jgi:hypothetical protein
VCVDAASRPGSLIERAGVVTGRSELFILRDGLECEGDNREPPMSHPRSRSRWRAAALCGLVLLVVFGWFGVGFARAQVALVTPRTRGEAEVGMGLEDAGKVQGLRRDPTGAGEFIDAKGTTWDVKGFNSNFPAKKGGFEVNAAMKSINREVGLGENVMVDTRSMSAAHVQELQNAVAADSSLAGKVLFWP